MSAGLAGFSEYLATYLKPEQIAEVESAYVFSRIAHEGQFRRNGDPYITHPLAVADILAHMHMDHQSLMAALLHDVIEDTGVSKEELGKHFGVDVADLVDGVTKLAKVRTQTKAEAQAENLRKMMLAMTQDIRVIIVKLADRLHNMRTLDVLAPEKRRRIAQETLDIYAPLANRLGMNQVRIELEDLCFEALFPMRAPLIRKAVRSARGNRKDMLETIRQTLEQRLRQEGLTARVLGREKHMYSIYMKMKDKQKSFSEIMDVYGFRVVVESVDACYRALGIMHNLYKPIPGKFKDYIAIPKANGYQSVHTVLKGQRGVPIEIQIRTEAMESMANNGVAAHWLYKDTGNTSQARPGGDRPAAPYPPLRRKPAPGRLRCSCGHLVLDRACAVAVGTFLDPAPGCMGQRQGVVQCDPDAGKRSPHAHRYQTAPFEGAVVPAASEQRSHGELRRVRASRQVLDGQDFGDLGSAGRAFGVHHHVNGLAHQGVQCRERQVGSRLGQLADEAQPGECLTG